jgi:polycystin 1L2
MSIKIWHDNTGSTGNDASWYLKHLIVHDLQTREKNFFICEKWLAIDKGDCLLERVLSLSLSKEKTAYAYLLGKQTKDKLRDDHLWFSIFARPIQSSFTRLDRLTCCFVLLSISMVMNIMYYGMDNSPIQSGIQIGSFFNLSLQQISIGVITNLIIFPPSLLLVQLFRRTKRKIPRINKLKKILNETKLSSIDEEASDFIKSKDTGLKKKKREFKFPWWFKIIAYILSFSFAGVSLFFVVIKGIEFGQDKVTKWLSSLIISFLSSVLLTQPLQVFLELS